VAVVAGRRRRGGGGGDGRCRLRQIGDGERRSQDEHDVDCVLRDDNERERHADTRQNNVAASHVGPRADLLDARQRFTARRCDS